MTDRTLSRARESGNVLFYIFAAIALLAALTFAVSQGSRGSVNSMAEDRARLFATETMAYTDGVAKAATTLRLRGFAPELIDFNNTALPLFDNAACSLGTCGIYDPAGGGVNYTAPPADWLDGAFAAGNAATHGRPYFEGSTCIPEVGTGGATCAAAEAELTMFVPFVKREVCVEINKLAGIPNVANDAPSFAGCPWSTPFTGAYTGGIAVAGGEAAIFKGKSAGCMKLTTACAGLGNSYHFYQVLLAR